MKKTFLYILLFIIILIFGYLAIKYIKYNKDTNIEDIDPEANENEQSKLYERNNTPISFDFNGYTYNLPAGCDYEFVEKNGEVGVKISNNTLKYGAGVSLIDESKYHDNKNIFEDYEDAMQSFKKSGVNVSNPQRRDKENIPVVTFEYRYDNYNGIYAYMKAYDSYIYQIQFFAEDNTFDYVSLDQIIDILSKAIATPDSN